MANLPTIVSGLREIAPGHDALICDIWGVLHDGTRAHWGAVDALRRFRGGFGPVILLSNAPRPPASVIEQFKTIGVPNDCYDAIVTSGAAARDDLAARAARGRLAMFHIGPERDNGVFEGLDVDCVEPSRASLVLCTGLLDDLTETPADYAELLNELLRRKLAMICANPDFVVQRGGRLVYCAGALAQAYEKIGGEVIYYGKPYAPIYAPVMAAARRAAARDIVSPLAVGDGLQTDIRGANTLGLEALFIADGVHGEEIEAVTPQALAALFEKGGAWAKAAMRALVW